MEMIYRYLTYHEMSATINDRQLSCLEMLGTYPTADIHETVRYRNIIIAGMPGISQEA